MEARPSKACASASPTPSSFLYSASSASCFAACAFMAAACSAWDFFACSAIAAFCSATFFCASDIRGFIFSAITLKSAIFVGASASETSLPDHFALNSSTSFCASADPAGAFGTYCSCSGAVFFAFVSSASVGFSAFTAIGISAWAAAAFCLPTGEFGP